MMGRIFQWCISAGSCCQEKRNTQSWKRSAGDMVGCTGVEIYVCWAMKHMKYSIELQSDLPHNIIHQSLKHLITFTLD